ncbi:MAG: class I SAM-dependent methyltransferase [Thermoplasmata archaeon]|nr:class I SAM-dependent methyltransferase [Thermoplasmata archaeon]
MNRAQKKAWEKAYTLHGRLWSRVHDKWFETSDGDLILDMGCGTGKSSEQMKGRIIAIDFSRKALNIARGQVRKINPICADACYLPFAESSFDLVRASFILGHLNREEQERTINEIHRVMKNEGAGAFEVFSTNDYRFQKARSSVSSPMNKNEISHQFFTADQLKDLLSGFRIKNMNIIEWRQKAGEAKKMNRSIIRAFVMKK